MTAHDVIVIGAGVNGLTAAAYLAASGLRVLVLERRPVVGGLTVTEEIAPGFRCDIAAHDAGWVSPDLVRELQLDREGLELLRPDPAVWTPLPDGGGIALWRDVARTAAGLRAHAPRDAERWPAFARRMSDYAGVLAGWYGAPPPRPTVPNLTDAAALIRFGRGIRSLGRNQMTGFLHALPMPVAELLDDSFQDDVLKGMLGAAGIDGVFQGPRSVGTTFLFLHNHVGAQTGVFRTRGVVRGGVGALAEAVAASARRRGAEIRCDAAVTGIVVRNDRATGVLLAGGEEVSARAVVSSADPRRTFLHLVGPTTLPPEFTRAVRNVRYRGAWAKVNAALGTLPRFRGVDDPRTLAGVVAIGPTLGDLERAYDAAKYGGISPDPVLEVRLPSIADPTLAPDGRHILSVRVRYTPYDLRDGEWDDTRRDALGELVVRALAEHAPDLPDSILELQVLTPRDLEERFALTEGDAADGEVALDQVLFMRPVGGWAHYETPIDGLFLCGSGTHPGPGIAGGAGRLAARAVTAALKARDSRTADRQVDHRTARHAADRPQRAIANT